MILVVGPGAVGGVLAARWAQAGRAVLLLGRSRAAESRLARSGLVLTSPGGARRRVRRLLSARREERPCEAAFFCVKAPDTEAAVRSARAWIGPGAAVVGLQNGLGQERILKAAFGPERTVLGSCYFAADRPRPGAVAHAWGNRIMLAGTSSNGAALAAARRELRAGNWEVTLARSEERMLWTKLCFNAATNPLGALCGVPNGELARDPALREIMLKALSEAVAIAREEGHRPLYADMADLVVRACRNAPRQRNSMLQDLQAGRRTEIRAITGPLLAAARRQRTPAPILSRLTRVLLRLEAWRLGPHGFRSAELRFPARASNHFLVHPPSAGPRARSQPFLTER